MDKRRVEILMAKEIGTMQKTGKLELTWVGKYEEKVIEPRILIEDKSKSYGNPNSKNMLIHGDNLIALQALKQDFTGKVKCIYIDPPYNTGSAFEYYDDSVEHSIWLSLMHQRLKILRELLSEDGVIVIECDKNEDAYLKIVCDEIFGRNYFVNSITVQSSTPSGTKLAHRNKTILKTKDTLLIYKKGEQIEIIPQYVPTDNLTNFNYWLEKTPNGYIVRNLRDVLVEHHVIKADDRVDDYKMSSAPEFEAFIIANKDKIFRKQPSLPPDIKRKSKLNPQKLIEYKDATGQKFIAQNGYRFAFLSSSVRQTNGVEKVTQLLCDIWTDISFHGTQYEGAVSFPAGKKPEALIYRIFSMFTKPGDVVLDSFLGSGTTAAVAQKMGLRWIGIELGEHAYTHCKVRLDKVIDGEQGGISKEVDWHGGGGYHFYELAPSLLIKNDKIPVYQVNPVYTFEMMCEAICKLEGFRYQPVGNIHGSSSENRFIHITTEFVNAEYIMSVATTLGEDQSLLIYGLKIQSDLRLPDNIEVKKIPKDLLEKCDFESEVR